VRAETLRREKCIVVTVLPRIRCCIRSTFLVVGFILGFDLCWWNGFSLRLV